MSLDRRDFLKIWWAAFASMYLSACVSKIKTWVDEILSPEQKDRRHILEIIREMKNYYPMNRKIVWYNDKKELNNLTHKNIYWYNLPKNVPGSFIQQWLENITFPDNISWNEPQIFISKIWWKVVLRFYIDWRLNTACYVSPWSNIKGRRTPENIYISERDLDVDHISRGTKREWAVMPYAIHITWWIRIHGSTWIINGHPRSHWCIRTWLFFIKNIYDTLYSRWLWKDVKINTRGIY